MRTLVFGSKGQLGQDLLERFEPHGPTLGHDLPELDIAEGNAVDAAVRSFAPDLIVNAAAYTNVEGAEDDEAGAFRANETGSRNVARAAHEAGAPLVYISTDFVFDGTKREPYLPDDPPAPLSVYGRSKLAGELAAREETEALFVVRTAWLYGPGGNTFPRKILDAAAKRPELKVVEDEVGSPTHTFDLAEAVAALAQTTAYGIYHGVNAGSCSRHAFAKRILERAGVDTPIHPCAADTFPTKAQRPAYSVLSTDALTGACGYRFRDWDEALGHFLERIATSASS